MDKKGKPEHLQLPPFPSCDFKQDILINLYS